MPGESVGRIRDSKKTNMGGRTIERREYPMHAADPDDDPAPQAPAPPDADACCGSGCERCVFDIYQDARERYLKALRAWQERQARTCLGRGGS